MQTVVTDLSCGRSGVADAVVLGAGISGLVAASVLVEQGLKRIVVVDSYDHVGGNHIDLSFDGYTFDVGSLIFQDDSPLVRRFPELLGRYVPIEPTWSRLTPQGRVASYPFSVGDDIASAGPAEWLLMAGSLVRGRLFARRRRNAQEFMDYWIGPRAARRTGLANYIQRMCGRQAVEIDADFASARMGGVSSNAMLSTHVKRLLARAGLGQRGEGDQNQQLARPRGGFAELYAPVVDCLRLAGVEFALGETPERIGRAGSALELELASGVVTTQRVISTIPLSRALALIDVTGSVLPTITLLTLCFSFEGDRGFESSILYNFSDDGGWKRLTVYSDFYGLVRGREYFAVEVPLNADSPPVAGEAALFERHAKSNGLFCGDLRLEGSFLLEDAYPVYSGGSAAASDAQRKVLRDHGIESFGRQGGFEYQPTARVSTLVAERALEWDPAGLAGRGA